jgi:FkbM family methyltransferase
LTVRPTLRERAAQAQSWAWRFRTLPFSERLFAKLAEPRVLRRRLFDRWMYVDVSRSSVQRLLFLQGELYIAERRLLRRLLEPDQRVVDIGANIGYYTLLFVHAIGAQGHLSCFEPEPDNLTELRRNVERNALANVEIFPIALGCAAGFVSFDRGINGQVREDGTGEVEVALQRLDDVVTSPVDFVKVDVDGYEGHVLAGAERCLEQHRPTLFLELHPALIRPPFTIRGILAHLAKLYGTIELYEPAHERTVAERLRARYLGRAVRRIADQKELLRVSEQEGERAPFWAVCLR